MQGSLVIHDDPAVTTALKRGLSYASLVPDVASSGAEGLDVAHDLLTDLVILAVMKPGLGGFEVLSCLRSAEDGEPILFLTAIDAPSEAGQGHEAGTDDYVMNPAIPLRSSWRTRMRSGVGKRRSISRSWATRTFRSTREGMSIDKVTLWTRPHERMLLANSHEMPEPGRGD